MSVPNVYQDFKTRPELQVNKFNMKLHRTYSKDQWRRCCWGETSSYLSPTTAVSKQLKESHMMTECQIGRNLLCANVCKNFIFRYLLMHEMVLNKTDRCKRFLIFRIFIKWINVNNILNLSSRFILKFPVWPPPVGELFWKSSPEAGW